MAGTALRYFLNHNIKSVFEGGWKISIDSDDMIRQ